MKVENDDNFAEQNIYDGNKSSIYLRPILNTAISISLFAMGLYRFIKIQAFENGEADITFTQLESLIYHIGGKFLLFAFVLFAALYFLYKAYHQYKNIMESKKKKFE
jgi:hypothetical protein